MFPGTTVVVLERVDVSSMRNSKEVEDSIQTECAIEHRCAREHPAEVTMKRSNSNAGFGVRVADDMAFIQHDSVPLDTVQRPNVFLVVLFPPCFSLLR